MSSGVDDHRSLDVAQAGVDDYMQVTGNMLRVTSNTQMHGGLQASIASNEGINPTDSYSNMIYEQDGGSDHRGAASNHGNNNYAAIRMGSSALKMTKTAARRMASHERKSSLGGPDSNNGSPRRRMNAGGSSSNSNPFYAPHKIMDSGFRHGANASKQT